MSVYQIAFNIAGAGAVVVGLLYVRHLLRTAGRGRYKDANLVSEFRETAPYHLLEDLVSD